MSPVIWLRRGWRRRRIGVSICASRCSLRGGWRRWLGWGSTCWWKVAPRQRCWGLASSVCRRIRVVCGCAAFSPNRKNGSRCWRVWRCCMGVALRWTGTASTVRGGVSRSPCRAIRSSVSGTGWTTPAILLPNLLSSRCRPSWWLGGIRCWGGRLLRYWLRAAGRSSLRAGSIWRCCPIWLITRWWSRRFCQGQGIGRWCWRRLGSLGCRRCWQSARSSRGCFFLSGKGWRGLPSRCSWC